jgi:hypothetical protein
VPCHLAYDEPAPHQTLLEDTRAFHDDPLIRDVAAVYVSNPTQLLPYLSLLLTTTNRTNWKMPNVRVPIGLAELLQAMHNMYDRYEQDREALKKARGVVLERIVYQLVCPRYQQVGDVCEHNVRVGVLGQVLTEGTIDVAAWPASGSNTEFYECKTQIGYLERKHLLAIYEAYTQCLQFCERPHNSIAAICTLTAEITIQSVLQYPRDNESLHILKADFPGIEFWNLQTIVNMRAP